jgi:alkylhydroperoxidase/carboxymuconolactone decarboxylase family protein YurZ
MYLPEKYTEFNKRYPEIFEKYKELGIACRESGPLDEKTMNLVKLGIAMGTNSRGGVMSATRKALEAGATKEEITHAVLMGLTTLGFPSMISSMACVSEVLDHVK